MAALTEPRPINNKPKMHVCIQSDCPQYVYVKTIYIYYCLEVYCLVICGKWKMVLKGAI